MKKILALILALLLYTESVFAVTAQVNNILEIGGQNNTTNPVAIRPIDTGLFTLVGNVLSNVNPGYVILTKMGGAGPTGTQYQVTAGKTLMCFGMYFVTNGSSVGFILGYGTAALGSNNTSTPPAGEVQYTYVSNDPTYFLNSTLPMPFYVTDIFQFPASSFPFVLYTQQAGNNNFVQLPCAEY